MAEGLIELVQQLRFGVPYLSLDIVDTHTEWTVCEVPAHLRTKYPANFQNKGLEFGLHRRTLTKSPTEVFKFDIARILHSKLAPRKSSWDQFARDVVGDVNRARCAYSGSSARFSDADVYSLLALDALFLVFLFKYISCGEFFLKEFEVLTGKLREILLLIDKTDFFLIDNQVPMYLLQSAIRQLCEIDEDTFEKRKDDPKFQLELKVEDELEIILNEAVLNLNPFTIPEDTSGSFCFQKNVQNSRDLLHQHLIKTYPVVPLVKSLINCQHLLDCLYTVICGHSLPFSIDEGMESSRLALESIPSATRLEAVGIRSMGMAPTLRDVKLSGTGYLMSAKLQLPKVTIYDYSESAFHNLALHEQFKSEGKCGDLRCYLQCMASLCIDASDLQILNEEGVINNHTGNDALAGLWDRTLKGVFTPFPSSTWVRCYRKIHQHRKTRLKRWRCEIWDLFFAKPWTLVSVIAGLILLILTALQTYYTVNPP
ncbi:hypothetical protein KC19_1G208400 [Ceratodon purpureus]|uniref:Uncharacterized protein n=1 Tax=Ceratodon purpureus TaxID=3225 RepID=A0A8T0J8P9_CERPU|nr:hypothetical protein KC19_1G208400 [Ceratodon purpureus]